MFQSSWDAAATCGQRSCKGWGTLLQTPRRPSSDAVNGGRRSCKGCSSQLPREVATAASLPPKSSAAAAKGGNLSCNRQTPLLQRASVAAANCSRPAAVMPPCSCKRVGCCKRLPMKIHWLQMTATDAASEHRRDSTTTSSSATSVAQGGVAPMCQNMGTRHAQAAGCPYAKIWGRDTHKLRGGAAADVLFEVLQRRCSDGRGGSAVSSDASNPHAAAKNMTAIIPRCNRWTCAQHAYHEKPKIFFGRNSYAIQTKQKKVC
jgi:hypothetical protein